MAENNEYTDLINEEDSSKQQQLKGNIYANDSIEPDQKAEALRLANEYKVPVSFAERNIDTLKKKSNSISANEYDELVKDFPGTTDFMSDQTNAGLVKDSIGEVKFFEKTGKTFLDRTGEHITDALVRGTMNGVKGLVSFGEMIQDTGANDISKMSGAEAQFFKDFYKDPVISKSAYKAARENIDTAKNPFLDKMAEKNGWEEIKNGNYLDASRALLLQGIESIPNLALFATMPVTGTVNMFAQESGSKYQENIEAGLSQEQSASNAIVSGAISTGIEMLGGIKPNVFKESIKNAEKILGEQTTKALLKQTAKDLIKTGVEEGAEESVTELAQSLYDYGTDANPKALDGLFGRMVNAGLVGSVAGFGVGGAGSVYTVSGATTRFQDSQKAAFTSETLDQLGEAAKTNKLRARSNEKFQEMVNKTAKNSGMENVYVDANTLKEYFQNKKLDPSQEIAKLGLTEKYEDALKTNGEVKITLGEWIDKTVDSEHYAGLKDDVRFNQETPSYNEIKKQNNELNNEYKKQIDLATQAEADGQEIVDDVYNQLVAAGTPKNEAKQQALIYRAVNVMAQRENVNALDLYKQLGLKILGGDTLTQEQSSSYVPMPSDNQGQISLIKNEDGMYDYDAGVLDIAKKTANPTDVQTIEQFLSGKMLSEMQIERLNSIYESAVNVVNKPYFQSKQETLEKDNKGLTDKIKEFFQWQSLEKNNENIVKSKEFKKWFKGSKASWEDGSPRKFFHGTPKIFKKFDSEKSLTSGVVAFFTANENFAANDYATGENGNIMPVYLSIKKPFIGSENLDIAKEFFSENGSVNYNSESEYLKSIKEGFWESLEEPAFVEFIKSKGFDAIQTNEYGNLNYGVLNQDSIVSAITGEYLQANAGSFNPDTNTIKLFESKDQSTFLHESAHLFLTMMVGLEAKNPTGSVASDLKLIKEWVGTDDLMSVDAQEKWARGFESYLMKGEAPTPQLRKAFNTFKTWLLRIYKNIEGLSRQAGFDVSVTPEIKGVMDRLLATEEEINGAESQLNIEMLTADQLGIKGKDAEAYDNAVQDARSYAEAQLNDQLLKELNKKQSKEYRDKFNAKKNEVLKGLYEQPIYQAMEAVRTGKNIMGEELDFPLKMDRKLVEMRMGKEIANLLPRWAYSAEGIDYAVVSEMFGFENPEQFITEFAQTPKLEMAAKLEAEKQMKVEYPELYNEPELKEEAMKAVHNEKRSLVLKYQLEYLQDKYASTLKSAQRRLVSRASVDMEVRNFAKQQVAKLKVSDLKPHEYLRAERKFAREAGYALSRGDLETAFKAKKQEYINHELYKESAYAKGVVEKTVKDYKKVFKSTDDLSKYRDIDLVNTTRAVLQRFGIVFGSQEDPMAYLEKIKEYDPKVYSGLSFVVADAIQDAGFYKDISFDKFIEMKDTVDALWDMSRNLKALTIEGKKIETEAIVKEAVGIINELNEKEPKKKEDYFITKSKYDKFKTTFLSNAAGLRRINQWADAMDYKGRGVFRKVFVEKIEDAGSKFRLKSNEYAVKMNDIFTEYKDIFSTQAIDAGFGTFRNKGELLMTLLHTGNQSNKSKLLRGYGWGTVNNDGSLDSRQFDAGIERLMDQGILTKRDFEFAQAVWDLLESTKAEAQKAHKYTLGYYFNEITASPVVNRFGTFRGGYIPASVDVYSSPDAMVNKLRRDVEESNPSFKFPTTQKGFTKSRVDSYAAPLDLDVTRLISHVQDVLKFSYFEPAIADVRKVALNKEFAAQIEAFDPGSLNNIIMANLETAASQRTSLIDTGRMQWIGKAASFLQQRSSMLALAGNITNVLQDQLSLIPATLKVKPKHIMVAAGNYLMNHSNAIETVYKSDFMKSLNQDNLNNIRHHISDIVGNENAYSNGKEIAVKVSMFAQEFSGQYLKNIVYLGAYNQAVAEGMTEDAAIREANLAVKSTQHMTLPEVVSSSEVGSPLYKLFTQFSGYFNGIYNLNSGEFKKVVRQTGLKASTPRLLHIYLAGFVSVAVMSQLVSNLMSGRGLDDNEDGEVDFKDFLSLFFGSQARFATAMVPFVGPTINTAVNKANDKIYDDKLNMVPAINFLEKGVGFVGTSYKRITNEQEFKKADVKDGLTLLGLITGYPTSVVGRPTGYVMDVQSGKAQPSGPVDFTRGLISGQSPKQ